MGQSTWDTTREARPGEQDGVHYHFVEEKKMRELIADNQFVEHAVYNGNLYGTSKKSLADVKAHNKIALLDIEMCGVATTQNSNHPFRFVFIEPPSVDVLRQRLVGRGDTSEEAIKNRIDIAMNELEERKKYRWDFVLVGDTMDQTFNDFCDWVFAKEETN